MSIPGSANPLLLASAAGAAGYNIERSLRFNSADSAYLSRTPASAGNRRTWTWAGWVKRSAGSTDDELFSSDSSDGFVIRFVGSTSAIRVYSNSGGGLQLNLITSAVYRDPSAWYHLVISVDTTQATSTDRAKIYVNGTQVTAFSTAAYPSQNTDLLANQAIAHFIGKNAWGVSGFNGYLADIYFIDGQALTPSSFAEVSATTGQLIPKAYTGTFTGNSFWLKFADNSAATATALGKDSSGLGNNWTPTNLAVANFRSATLTKTGGSIQTLQDAANAFDGVLSTSFYCEPSNPSSLTLTLATGQAFSTLEINGYVQSSSKIVINGVDVSSQLLGDPNVYRTITGVTSPFTTLYMEVTGGGSIPVIRDMRFNGVSPGWIFTGSDPRSDSLVDTPTSYGTDTGAGGEVRGNYCTWNPLNNSTTLSNGNLQSNQPVSQSGTDGTIYYPVSGKWIFETQFLSPGAADHIGIIQTGATLSQLATSANSDSVLYRTDGNIFRNTGGGFSIVQTVATVTSSDIVSVAFNVDTNTLQFYKNGSALGTAITLTANTKYAPWCTHGGGAGGSHTNFGQRPFAYTAPSGFKALCDTNLPAPVVAKPNTVMDVKLYTGNGSTQTISGLGFGPDLVWVKSRNNASWWHVLTDAVRGGGYFLHSNNTNAEGGGGTSLITGFTSDGFSLNNSPNGTVNALNDTYVAWTWDAGSSTVTNTAGSITSQVRANASAGFSIVTYTGNSTAGATVGHGLGVTPAMIIVKKRSGASNWPVSHTAYANTSLLNLDNTNSLATSEGTRLQRTNGTVFTVGDAADYSITNETGSTYVAYCFAPVVGYSSFGSYTGNGSTDGPAVWLGFRPKWLLIKRTDSANDWYLQDSARDPYNPCPAGLFPNLSAAEDSSYRSAYPNDMLSNGFKLRTSNAGWNASGGTYIYIAFAESPFQYARAR